MTAFTDPTGADYDPFDVDTFNELVEAYSERRQVIGSSAESLVEAGDDAQDVSLVAAMHTWIEAQIHVAGVWVDHTQGTQFDGEDEIPVFETLAQFRTAAGLPSGGFRRATEWDGSGTPTWSYGTAQAGDIIGYWIIEDLQKAFSALAWTLKDCQTNSHQFWIGYGQEASCTAAVYSAETDFAANEWEDVTGYFDKPYSATGLISNPITGLWQVTGYRNRFKPSCIVSTEVPCTVDFYMFTRRPDGYEYYGFQDVDSLSADDAKIFLIETLSEDSSSPRVGAYVGDYSTCPVPNAGLSCPTEGYVGIEGLFPQAVLKWSFSKSNL